MICEKHNIEKKSLKFSLGGEDFEKWFCDECGAEETVADNERKNRLEMERKQVFINEKLDNVMISPRFLDRTFENFKVENPKQQIALDKIIKFLDRLDRMSGLIFSGGTGTGKNHLACAMAREVVKRGQTALVTTALKLIRRVKQSWDDKTEFKTIQNFIDPTLLVIDEVGVQYGSDSEKIILSEIINERYENLRPTVLITNLTISELKSFLGDRVIDRFREGGEGVIFDWESYRGKTI